VKTGLFTLLALGLALAPRGAQASSGLSLRLPAKSPLVLRTLDAADPLEPLPLREPLLYLGGTLTWRPLSKTAELELAGSKALLMLEEGGAFTGGRRLGLPAPLHWKDGRLVLSRASLELVLKSLSPAAPAFESATALELAALSPQGAPPPAEPTVVIPPDPVIVKRRAGDARASGPLRRLIIDAGHGGYDPGAHGKGGVEEKDVCLDIARRLAKMVRQALPGVDVVMTRDSDDFISLRKRTVIANESDADLFISIHNNASPNSKSRGSQVFFYDSKSSDKAAEDLAMRENEDANYLEFILFDMRKEVVRDQSIMLAQSVQDRLAELGQDLGVKNRKLHYAPFYVLARTKMPAILVEVAFISNPREEKLLRNAAFRGQVAEGILDGLKAYRVELAKQ
jgi:N-acetylmuramoyl-L-alanine amidase